MTENNSFSALPNSWLWVKTGDICEGVVPGRTKPKNFNGTIPWITLPDVTELYVSNSQNHFAVTREDAEAVGMKVMPKESVLMSCVGQFGLVCIAKNDIVPNQQFHGFICLDKVLPEYVAYALMTQVAHMNQLASATTIAYINKTKCNSIQIPLSPFNEQRRIVTKIEALMARSQQVKEALEAIPPLLDQFRQSVLAAAFRGDLTADWRAQFSIDINRGWAQSFLKDLLSEPLTNGHSVPDANQGFPVLRLTCLRDNRVDLKERKIGAWNEEQAKKFLVCKDDFLVARGNGSLALVGRGGLVNCIPDDVAYPDTLIRVRVKHEVITPEFLSLVWNSYPMRKQVEAAARTTAGIHKINQKSMEAFVLPIPPVEEQKEIVRRVDSLLATAACVEKYYREIEAHQSQLDQSILAKAFRGELVPQDPSDEPASVLLERIRAEREKADKSKKANGKGTAKGSRKAKAEATTPEQLSLPGLE